MMYFYADNWPKGTPADFSGLYNTLVQLRKGTHLRNININGVVDERYTKGNRKCSW